MALATTTTGTCGSGASCTVTGVGQFTFWAPKAYSATELTGTVVVVQIINTDLNTTRFSTIGEQVPSGFEAPPTNSAGIRTADVTYLHHGKMSTTTLAYPTPFLELPDDYTVIGDYQLADSSGDQRCVRHANQAYDIPFNVQPPWRLGDPMWNLSKYLDEEDPLGWGYSYLESSNWTAFVTIDELIDVLPDDNPDMPHSVVKACAPETPPQPYVLTYNPNWRVVGSTSVIYEGDTPTTATSTASLDAPPVTPMPGTTAQTDATGAVEMTDSATSATTTATTANTSTTRAVVTTRSLGNSKAALSLWAAIWMCSSAVVCVAM